jgi:hypothetical protein
MLRSAAEVEHQLFLQYLYAASSLKDPLAAGIVADIAVEEMGHLLTVNNLLIALDGDPYFGRGLDNPTTPTSDPFAFKLRAASQPTLAMFTAAESPSPTALSSWFARVELARILKIADTPLGHHPVQRVGALYQKIVELLTSESSLDEAFASATQYLSIQASPREAWSHAGVSPHDRRAHYQPERSHHCAQQNHDPGGRLLRRRPIALHAISSCISRDAPAAGFSLCLLCASNDGRSIEPGFTRPVAGAWALLP